jgi:hypothetical protein
MVFLLGGWIMGDANSADDRNGLVGPVAVTQPKGAAALKPKGACWYCNQPLDNVRRFCNKSCADDYRTEEEAFNNPSWIRGSPSSFRNDHFSTSRRDPAAAQLSFNKAWAVTMPTHLSKRFPQNRLPPWKLR